MIDPRDKHKHSVERRLAGMVIIGTISQVDHEKGRYRVATGDGFESDWIPSTVSRSGDTRTFESRDVGEQVIVASPSGDPSQGVILGAIATDERQAGRKGSEHRTIYPDGTIVDYDDEAGGMRIALAAGRSTTTTVGNVSFVTSEDGVSITVGGVSLSITGDGFTFSGGQMSHDGRNIGSTHVHGGVTPGGATTREPQ